MHKVVVKDPKSDKEFTIEVTGEDINKDLDKDVADKLLSALTSLAKLYAFELGYVKIPQTDDDGVVI